MEGARTLDRPVLLLVLGLGAWGLLTVGLMAGAWSVGAAGLVPLVAAASGSVAAPVGALVTLLVAERARGRRPADADPADASREAGEARNPRRDGPLVDRSVVLIGNGCADVRVEIEGGSARVVCGGGAVDAAAPGGTSTAGT